MSFPDPDPLWPCVLVIDGWVDMSQLPSSVGLEFLVDCYGTGDLSSVAETHDTGLRGGTPGWQHATWSVPYDAELGLSWGMIGWRLTGTEGVGAPGASFYLDDVSISIQVNKAALPVSGLVGLGVLAGLSALAGALFVRKRV
jgi:hypothetical protein